MIDFTLTDEQREFRDLARQFAEKTIRPATPAANEKGKVPWDVLGKALQAGLLTYYIPEAYGGSGVDSVVTRLLIDEELSWGCAGVSTIIGGVGLCATPIMLAGTEEQKLKYLTRFCEPGPDNRPRLGAFALTEPSAGSDPAGLMTEARREHGKYVLNGYKQFITNGGISDIYVIFATVDPALGLGGISAFIVEGDTPGLVAGKKEEKMGIRASHTASLILEDVEIPVANRLGEEGEGFKIAMRTFNITRAHVAISAVGLARAAYEYALNYAQERRQFGKPIYANQAVSFMLTDMAIQIDASRLLAWRAAARADRGQPAIMQASMAKAFAADMAMKVTTDAVQVLGGYGYSREYPVEKWMRDAKIMQIYEGTSQIQRLVISRQLAA